MLIIGEWRSERKIEIKENQKETTKSKVSKRKIIKTSCAVFDDRKISDLATTLIRVVLSQLGGLNQQAFASPCIFYRLSNPTPTNSCWLRRRKVPSQAKSEYQLIHQIVELKSLDDKQYSLQTRIKTTRDLCWTIHDLLQCIGEQRDWLKIIYIFKSSVSFSLPRRMTCRFELISINWIPNGIEVKPTRRSFGIWRMCGCNRLNNFISYTWASHTLKNRLLANESSSESRFFRCQQTSW